MAAPVLFTVPEREPRTAGTGEGTMRRFVSLVVALFVAVAASAQGPAPKGHLVLIGGGEKPPEAIRKFIELAGGPESLIVAIPTASTEPDAGDYYVKLLRDDYGCTNAVALDIKSKADAMRPDFAETAGRARGIFFGGGDQARITAALLDTPVGAAIADAFARGAVIGGHSAGTACQSDPMITGEGNFKVIRANSVELARGLGFFRGVIVDQHFIARQRSNRLISVILEHPDLLGVGVDEDTAVWVRPDGTFRVMGASCVMVLDAKGAEVTRQPAEGGKDLLGVHGLKVEILLPGEAYDLQRRAIIPAAAVAR
jgi:cyanophycinase